MKKVAEAFGGTIIITLLIISIIFMILGTVKFLGEPNIRDEDAYPLERYYVHEGDSAWEIYKETCPEANWTLWSEYVAEINDDIKIGELKIGDVIYIPVKK